MAPSSLIARTLALTTISALTLASCSAPAPAPSPGGGATGGGGGAASAPASTEPGTASAATAADIVAGPRLGISDLGLTFVAPRGSVEGLDASFTPLADGTSKPVAEWFTSAPTLWARDHTPISIVQVAALETAQPNDADYHRTIAGMTGKTVAEIEPRDTAVGRALLITYADDAHAAAWDVVLHRPTQKAEVTFTVTAGNPQVSQAVQTLLLSSLAEG